MKVGRDKIDANDPTVWSGRVLQVGSDDLEMIGLALLYPAPHEGACVKLLHSDSRLI